MARLADRRGGVTVYSLPVTPVVLLSQDGVTVSASLSEP